MKHPLHEIQVHKNTSTNIEGVLFEGDVTCCQCDKVYVAEKTVTNSKTTRLRKCVFCHVYKERNADSHRIQKHYCLSSTHI